MPYAPSVAPWSASPSDYTAGQSRAGAITNVGNAISNGLNQWYKNDAQDTQTRAQVAALLPQFADKLTNPEDKDLVESFINHKTDYKKNAYLLGLFATLKSQQDDQIKNQQVQAQTALQQQQVAAAQRMAAHQQFLGNVASGAGQYMYRNDPTQNPLVMQAARLYQATGQAPTPDNLLDYSARMNVPRPSIKPFTYTSQGEDGQPIRVTVDEFTGKKIAEGPAVPAAGTPEQQAKAASLIEQAKSQAEDSQKFLTDVADNAENARVRASSIKRINNLYDAGATTGFGQPQLTAIQAALNRVGLAKGGLGNQQQLNKELSNLVMETGRDLMKGGGAVSNYERSLIQDATANPSLDPQANKQILKVMAAIADRAVIIDKKRQQLDEQGVPPVEIARELRKLRDSIPVGLESLGANPADSILAKYGINPK